MTSWPTSFSFIYNIISLIIIRTRISSYYFFFDELFFTVCDIHPTEAPKKDPKKALVKPVDPLAKAEVKSVESVKDTKTDAKDSKKKEQAVFTVE